MTYAADDLLAEVAYVSSVYGWSLNDTLDLEHPDRRRFIELVAGDAEANEGTEQRW
ncbi:MAG: DUF6760 family protein [Actinomycetota bacterium]